MAEFIVRARAAPVNPGSFRQAIGKDVGVEYLADIIKAGLLVSQGHRRDVVLHLVLEKSQDYSRVVTVDGDQLGSLPDMQESSLLEMIAEALEAGRLLAKDSSIVSDCGITVLASSFEKLVKEKAAVDGAWLLATDGEDIRYAPVSDDSVFVMTDHTPMPKKTFKSMARQGVKPLSLGPTMLHASQCVAVVLNELDRRLVE